MEKFSWTDRVRNEEALQRVKTERSIRPTVKPGKAKWISHILRRNCLLKHLTDGKIEGRSEGKGKTRKRHKLLQGDLKEKKGYWKMKQEAIDRTLWRTRYGGGYGPVVRQTTK